MKSTNRWDALLEGMRSLASTSLGLIHTRVELIGVELEQELWRARSLLTWALAVLLLALLAIGFAGIALIAAFWDTHRVLACVLVVAVLLALTLIAAGFLLKTLNSKPRLFEATLAQLEQDADALRRDP
ncbi:MAG: phage holin family protein [Steroidobacteraceae bacterium]